MAFVNESIIFEVGVSEVSKLLHYKIYAPKSRSGTLQKIMPYQG